MASKGQPTQDDGEAGPLAQIQEQMHNRKEDEALSSSGTSVQEKVKEKERKNSSEKKKKRKACKP